MIPTTNQHNMARLRDLRAKADLYKINPPQMKFTTPSLASLNESVVDDNDDEVEPDLSSIVALLFNMWPGWDTFDFPKQSILYGVVDYILYAGHEITNEMKTHILDVVACYYNTNNGAYTVQSAMGDATQISNIVMAVLENVNPYVPMQPPRVRPRAQGPPLLHDAPGTSRPRLSFPGVRVTAITNRNQIPQGDRSGRCETYESDIQCRKPTEWVTGDTSIVWNCTVPQRPKKKVRFTEPVRE